MNRGIYVSKDNISENKTISADINKKARFPVKIVTELQEITGELVVRTFFGADVGHKQFQNGLTLNQIMADITLKVGFLSTEPFQLLRGLLFYPGTLYKRTWLLTREEKDVLSKLLLLREVGMELINQRLEHFEKYEAQQNNDFLQIYCRAYREGKVENITKEEILQNFITF